jgi:hypothetical protein
MIVSARDAVAKWKQAQTSGAAVDGLNAAQWEARSRDLIKSLEMMRGLYDIFGRTL